VSTASEDDERAQSRFRRPSIAKRRGGVADEREGEVDEGEDEDDETDAHRSRRLCEDWNARNESVRYDDIHSSTL